MEYHLRCSSLQAELCCGAFLRFDTGVCTCSTPADPRGQGEFTLSDLCGEPVHKPPPSQCPSNHTTLDNFSGGLAVKNHTPTYIRTQTSTTGSTYGFPGGVDVTLRREIIPLFEGSVPTETVATAAVSRTTAAATPHPQPGWLGTVWVAHPSLRDPLCSSITSRRGLTSTAHCRRRCAVYQFSRPRASRPALASPRPPTLELDGRPTAACTARGPHGLSVGGSCRHRRPRASQLAAPSVCGSLGH